MVSARSVKAQGIAFEIAVAADDAVTRHDGGHLYGRDLFGQFVSAAVLGQAPMQTRCRMNPSGWRREIKCAQLCSPVRDRICLMKWRPPSAHFFRVTVFSSKRNTSPLRRWTSVWPSELTFHSAHP
jgi:hypothetical protein